MSLPQLSTGDLQAILRVEEFEELAKVRLSRMAYEYSAAGVADEWTVRENRLAFDRIRLRPRVCVDVSRLDPEVTLFGRRHEFPILLAPCAFQRLFHPNGELEAAEGARRAGTTYVCACFAGFPLEEIATASSTPLWFQLYVQPDRGFTRELAQRAEAAGYEALVVTADVPVNGPRYRELNAGFRLPEGVIRANLLGLGQAAATASHRPHGRDIYSAVRAANLTWKDIGWLKSITRIPVVVKGILEPEDASLAVEHGADAVYVSNHGGRSVDTLPAAIDALGPVVDRLGGARPVLFDGGVRRGTDIFKALALGASVVLIGRPYLFGLAAAGADGVARVVEILRTELEMTMGLAGAAAVGDIRVSGLWRRPNVQEAQTK